ncbi:MAG: hypothetical protein B9S34_02465 [Opitutia bacterium Tous-C1TDCM]|nr:MAG: hypothetical protein B9S34_02465 [Opitutae bacterium Tous-C1TDCM]
MNGRVIAHAFAGATRGAGKMHRTVFANREVSPAAVPEAAGNIGSVAGVEVGIGPPAEREAGPVAVEIVGLDAGRAGALAGIMKLRVQS